MVFKGIDVSRHQGFIDWKEVAKDIDFAMLRGGYGESNFDDKILNNIYGCEKNNIPYGFYWFSYALNVNDAIKEAEKVIFLAKHFKPLYPIAFDFEYDSIRYANDMRVTISNQLIIDMTTAFCETLEKAGFYAMVYSNQDFIKTRYGENIFKRFDLWYAWLNETSNRKVNLHQYSHKGTVKGINGLVDLNYAYIDYPSLIKKNKLNGWL